MSSLTLKVEVALGTPFHKAARETKDLAARLNLAYVEFNFNGIDVYADGSYTQYTEADLDEVLEYGYKTKFISI